MAERSRASLIGCRGCLEVVSDGLVEVHGHLEEEVPHAQVAAEQARRLEPETLQYIISHYERRNQ